MTAARMEGVCMQWMCGTVIMGWDQIGLRAELLKGCLSPGGSNVPFPCLESSIQAWLGKDRASEARCCFASPEGRGQGQGVQASGQGFPCCSRTEVRVPGGELLSLS